MLQLDARMRATGASCTSYLYRHDACRAANCDPTAYPYKCRSVELHHIAYQIGLWFPFLCLLQLQPHYTDMVHLSRVHPVPWLLYVIRRTGPKHVDAPGNAIIWSPLKSLNFFYPEEGWRTFLTASAQTADNFRINSFACGNLNLVSTKLSLIPVTF